jgi:hypothetical protein
MVLIYQSYEHVSTIQCINIVSKLEVHIISKTITHKIMFTIIIILNHIWFIWDLKEIYV